MSEELILVRLTDEQAETARNAIGPRKRITHALVCGSHGNIFGTERFCRKYYDAWRTIFSDIFPDGARETETYKFDEYISRFDVVTALMNELDARKKSPNSRATTSSPSVWQRALKLFSK
ncbi:hypothetical protein [Pseudidiomarina sp.]|uniref:hypothetical protein n=1 Tax=Pseudidiomarina sp. TaxID=2081707 RepID=UPI003A97CF2C